MSANSAAHPAIVPPSSVRGQHYDALVVGSGHNGLVAALCAVCAGLRVWWSNARAPSIERYMHSTIHSSLSDAHGRISSAFFMQWVPYEIAGSSACIRPARARTLLAR